MKLKDFAANLRGVILSCRNPQYLRLRRDNMVMGYNRLKGVVHFFKKHPLKGLGIVVVFVIVLWVVGRIFIGKGIDSLVLCVSTAILAATTSFLAFLSSKSQDVLKAQVMPIIAFGYDGARWTFKNVGNGPALNALVAHMNKEGVIDYPIRQFNPLAPGDCFRIEWKKCPKIFIAKYEDIHGRIYTAECGRSTNRVVNQDRYPDLEKKGQVLQFWQLIRKGDVSPCGPQIDSTPKARDVSQTA